MNVSFLNPLFWLGILAIAGPVYLHLRRKQPQNLIRFSALRFLDDQPEPKQSPWRLRDILLFALRVIALLAMIASFAWPFVRKADQIAVKESRVYVLDNSLSQQVERNFENAKERVLHEIGKADRDTQIAVVELTYYPRIVAAFGDSKEMAQQKVQLLQPSHQRGSYLAAFRQANALLSNSLGDRKKIIFLTDNQENQWAENGNTPPFLQNVEVEVTKAKPATLKNVSINDPRAQRVFLGDKSLVNFSVQVVRQGEIQATRLTLRVNGQEIVNTQLELKGHPENVVFQTQWEADPSVELKGEVSIDADEDALVPDNKAYFALAPVQEGTVAVLAHSSFLKLALSPEIMRGHWAARFIDPTKIADEGQSSDDAEVLCIESSYLQSTEARKLLWRYLSNGRGVFLMMNRVTPMTRGYLKEIGFEILPEETRLSGPAHFQYIFANHPIFHPFTSPDYGNLMEIKVTDPIHLRSKEAVPLIFTEKGEPVFFQNPKHAGKLYVSSFAFDRNQTSWPVHATFIPFLDLCLQNARAADQTSTVFEPGETFTQTFATNSGIREVTLRSDKIISRNSVLNGKVQVRLPDAPGLYTVAFDGQTNLDKVIAINPSPKESQLIYVEDPPAIQLWQLPASAKKPMTAQAASEAEVTLSAIWQQHIWWWLLLTGLLALVFETAFTTLRRRSV